MSTNTDEELIHKKGATSVVWKCFGYKQSDIEQTVPCKVCRKSIPFYKFFRDGLQGLFFQFDIKKSLHNNDSQVVLILFFILEQLIGSHRPRLIGNLIYFYCVNKENMYLNFALVFLICLEKNRKKILRFKS